MSRLTYFTQLLPRFWFLNPWAMCVRLFRAVRALQAYIESLEASQRLLEQDLEALKLDRHRLIVKVQKLDYQLEFQLEANCLDRAVRMNDYKLNKCKCES